MEGSRKLLLVGLLLINYLTVMGQKFTISGEIQDESGVGLIGVNVYLSETLQGTSTNFNGAYEIKGVESGSYTLITSLVGFAVDSVFIDVSQDMSLSIQLRESSMDLQGIQIIADRIIERTAVSNISFGKKTLKTNQGLTEDPIRTMATLPGVGWAGDLFSPSQIYVRGGAPEENLFLMDNNQIYFPYYFGGQKSIFNTDAIDNVELLTGGFSAAYGNHMSSVLNVQTRAGNFDHYAGNFSVGFYNAAALFETPIVKDKFSVLLAFRKTYLDLFLDESAEFPVPSLSDVTYSLTYKVNEDHTLSFSGLSSSESLDFITGDPDPGLPNRLETSGKNHFQSLQLRSTVGARLYNKLAVTNTINENVSDIGDNINLNIDAWQVGLRDDLTIYLSNQHKLKTGIQWQFGTFDFAGNLPLDPLETDPNDTTITLRDYDVSEKGEVIRGGYFLYDGNPVDRLGFNAGIRFDQNPGGDYVDISPRLAMNYQISRQTKIRFSTGVYHQFPGAQGGEGLVSSRSTHYIVGFEHRFSNQVHSWIEGYHKDYDDLVYYDANLNYSNDGYGEARGIELFLRKEEGRFTGWISYALSHSQRLIPLLDEVTDFDFDQRHIFNLVAEYKPSKTLSQWYIPSVFQTNLRMADGIPYTPVFGATNQGNGWEPVKGEPLSARNTDYLNLNLRIEWTFKFNAYAMGTSFIEVWNLTNSKNILGRSYQYGAQYPNNVLEQPYYTTPILLGGGFKMEFAGIPIAN